MGRSCIKKGATGADVDLLRMKMYEAGHLATSPYVATASGFDSELHAAVEGFQGSNGLTVDGIAGPDTWAKLGESGDPCSSGGSRSSSSSGALVAAGSASLPLVQRKWFLPVVAGVVGVGILALLFVPKKGKKR